MRKSVLLVPVLVSLLSTAAQAAFFQWTDADGVVHFTDSRKKIPQKYRKKAKELKYLGPSTPSSRSPAAPAPAQPPAPQTAPVSPPAGETAAPQAAPPAAEPNAPLAGGHDETWWRERFGGLRRELQLVREGLSQKQARLVELRRQRVIFSRPSDREAVNAMEAQVSADETRVNDLLRQIDVLDRAATAAGVPMEWRQ